MTWHICSFGPWLFCLYDSDGAGIVKPFFFVHSSDNRRAQMIANERDEDLDKIASIMVHEISGDVSRALDAMACYHAGLQRGCFFYFKSFC